MTLIQTVLNELACRAAVSKVVAESNPTGPKAWALIQSVCDAYGVAPAALGHHLSNGTPFDCAGGDICAACNR